MLTRRSFLKLSGAVVLAGILPFNVTAVVDTPVTHTIEGLASLGPQVGDLIQVSWSSGNDGLYRICESGNLEKV